MGWDLENPLFRGLLMRLRVLFGIASTLFILALVASPRTLADQFTINGNVQGGDGLCGAQVGFPTCADTLFPIPTNHGLLSIDFTSGPFVSGGCPSDGSECVFNYGAGGSITLTFENGTVLTGSFLDGVENMNPPQGIDMPSCCFDFEGDFTLNGFVGKGSMEFGEIPTVPELGGASITYSGTPAPEPGTLALLATGLLGLAPLIRRRITI